MPTFYRVNLAMANNEDLRQGFALADQTGSPIDLTGALLKLRLESSNGVDALEASTTNGHITLTEPDLGRFEIAVPAAAMRALPTGVYRHDLLLLTGVRQLRVWEGALTLNDGVTE